MSDLYLNEYKCSKCNESWDDDGEKGDESDCPSCGEYIEPSRSFFYGNGPAEDDDGE